MARSDLIRQLPRWALMLAAAGCTAPQGDAPAPQANSPAPQANSPAPEVSSPAPPVNQAALQPAPEGSFHALGTEPFWAVSVANGRIEYDVMDGKRFSVPAPQRENAPGGWIWRTPRITVHVVVRPCSDGMSTRVYPADVKIAVAGMNWLGCGGYTLDDSLAGSAWQIVQIDEEEVSGAAYRLEFTGDRISGRAGCNRFSGPYRRGEHGAVTFGPLATTRMACPEPAMAHERTVLALLGNNSYLTYALPGTLAIGNEEGGILLRRLP